MSSDFMEEPYVTFLCGRTRIECSNQDCDNCLGVPRYGVDFLKSFEMK